MWCFKRCRRDLHIDRGVSTRGIQLGMNRQKRCAPDTCDLLPDLVYTSIEGCLLDRCVIFDRERIHDSQQILVKLSSGWCSCSPRNRWCGWYPDSLGIDFLHSDCACCWLQTPLNSPSVSSRTAETYHRLRVSTRPWRPSGVASDHSCISKVLRHRL